MTNDSEILFEGQLEDFERFLDVGHRRGDRHQGNDDVALANLPADPIPVGRHVPFDEDESGVSQRVSQLVAGQIHPHDPPVGLIHDGPHQTVTDEPIHTEDEDLHFSLPYSPQLPELRTPVVVDELVAIHLGVSRELAA